MADKKVLDGLKGHGFTDQDIANLSKMSAARAKPGTQQALGDGTFLADLLNALNAAATQAPQWIALFKTLAAAFATTAAVFLVLLFGDAKAHGGPIENAKAALALADSRTPEPESCAMVVSKLMAATETDFDQGSLIERPLVERVAALETRATADESRLTTLEGKKVALALAPPTDLAGAVMQCTPGVNCPSTTYTAADGTTYTTGPITTTTSYQTSGTGTGPIRRWLQRRHARRGGGGCGG
jgi:hypothetical protein